MTDYSVYNNPLSTRYASKEMQQAFSDEKRFKLWRKLWIALSCLALILSFFASRAADGDHIGASLSGMISVFMR